MLVWPYPTVSYREHYQLLIHASFKKICCSCLAKWMVSVVPFYIPTAVIKCLMICMMCYNQWHQLWDEEIHSSIKTVHRCLQSCVGTWARLGYTEFHAQLQKAYFVATLYTVHCTMYVILCISAQMLYRRFGGMPHLSRKITHLVMVLGPMLTIGYSWFTCTQLYTNPCGLHSPFNFTIQLYTEFTIVWIPNNQSLGPRIERLWIFTREYSSILGCENPGTQGLVTIRDRIFNF